MTFAHPNFEPRTVRLVGDADHGTKFEIGTTSAEQKRVRSLETVGGGKKHTRQPVQDTQYCKLRCSWEWATIRQSLKKRGKTYEHQVDVYEKLATSQLDDDVKISVVLCEAPTTFRDNLLVNSQQVRE